MVLLYMVCHGSHQYTVYTPFYVSIDLPAPWIRHGNYGNIMGKIMEIWNFGADENYDQSGC